MPKPLIDHKSIAVLPFDNLSADPENEYFSDGMTEEIISALSRIEGLKVTARTSTFVFKHQKQDVRKIGRELQVSLVLEGSVRKSGDRVRITAQLIRTDNGFHIWSENFDRQLTDIFDLQDEVSLLIANKIREDFGHLYIQEHLVDAPTSNVEAYQLYLKGRYHHNKWDMDGFMKAPEYYKKSIEEDPGFDLPYFGAGLSYSFLGSWGGMNRVEAFHLAEDFFDRGKRLNKGSAYGYFCMGKHLFWGLWRYKEAHHMLQQTLAVQPDDANSNEFMAEIYTALGDFDSAHQFIDKALRTSPVAPNHFYSQANIFYLQGRFEEALEVLDRGLAIVPGFTVSLELKLACLIQLGRMDEVQRTVSENSDLLVPDLYEVMCQLLHQGESVQRQSATGTLERVRGQPALLFGWDLSLTAYLEDPEVAMALLSEKSSGRVGQVINFKHDPFLAPLRQLPAYERLVERYFPDNSLVVVDKAVATDKDPMVEEDIARYADLLLSQMASEKYFLAAGLSLRELAEKIDLHPNKLSWLLNEKLGNNFYEFVNNYRLKEFQKRALDKSNSHLSILGLALDSGFSSKSVFNEYFKKSIGMTPKAWVSQNQ